jgi:hypothetical protein
VEYNCEEFVSKDTCVLRSFSTYKFKTGIETQTKYESDSLIRFIKEVKKEKTLELRNEFLGFFPVKFQIMKKQLL